MTAPEGSAEAKSAETTSDIEKAAKVEQAVNAITEELHKGGHGEATKSVESSSSAPVTRAEGVIPHAETAAATTQVEKAVSDFSAKEDKGADDDKDFIDFTPDKPDEATQVTSEEVSAPSTNLESAAAPVASNDQINNSVESSNPEEL